MLLKISDYVLINTYRTIQHGECSQMTCKVISNTKSQNFAFDDLGAQGHTEGLKGRINSTELLLTSPVCHAVYTKAVIIFYC